MGYAIKNNIKVAIKEEVTEGTFVVPAAGSDFVQLLGDGASMEPSKELLERDLIGGGLSAATPRTGLWSVSGQLNVEMKSNGTEGNAPEYGLLLEGCLGTTRAAVTKTSSDADGGTYSDVVICFATADVGVYNVGDILHIKRAGAHHISPITDITGTEVTLLVADPAGAFVDGLVVSALTTYLPADEDHKAISVSRYIEDAVLEKAAGCKITSMGMEGFTTGQMGKFAFGFEGLTTDRIVSANALTPSFDTALPPIVLSACVYQDGVNMPVNDVAFSVENELGFITSTCSEQGKISSRVTKRTITGSVNPYKQNDSVAQWEKFEANTEYSIFGFAKVPSATTGEYSDIVAFYMPYCVTTEIAESEKDGLLQDGLSFTAGGGNQQETEIFVTFI